MNRILRILGIQREIAGKVFLLFAYLLLLISGFIISKAARDALFLTEFGALKLPYVYIGIAILTGLIVGIYTHFAERISKQETLIVSQAAVATVFVLFWWLLSNLQWRWLVFAFYVWVTIYNAILISQFWLSANDFLDARQAKRAFGLIGSGGIIGGIVGGFAAKYLAPLWGAEQLLLLVAGTCLITIVLIRLLYIRHSEAILGSVHQETGNGIIASFKTFRQSKYLLWIGLILGVTELISTIVDYQFKTIAQRSFPGVNQLSAFFGSFYGYMNVATLALQILLTRRVLNNLGVKWAILILPLTIAGGSTAFLFAPVLWSAIFLKFSDDGLGNSVNRAAMELLYLPVAPAIKEKMKIFIDSVVVRLSGGLGGIIILIYLSLTSSSVVLLSVLVLALTGIWLVLCVLSYQQYVDAFREGLKRRSIDPETTGLQIKDVSTLETLMQALNSPDERQVLYAIEFLQCTGKNHLISPWLLHHSSARVRLKVVQILSERADRSVASVLRSALQDENVEVQAEAVSTLCVLEPENYDQMVQSLAQEKDSKLRRAAILCASHGAPVLQEKARQWLTEMANASGPDGQAVRMEAAKALGKLPSSFHDLYSLLTKDEDLFVLKETIRSAAMGRNLELIPWLVQKLGDRKLKLDARRALLQYGPEIIPVLETSLTDPSIDLWSRRHIPRTIGAFYTQEAVDALLKYSSHTDRFMRFKVLKALNKARLPNLKFIFDRQNIQGWLWKEVEEHFHYLALAEAIYITPPSLTLGSLTSVSANDQKARAESSSSPFEGILTRTLEVKLLRSLDRIFRLLALIYPPRDIFQAYSSLVSTQRSLRSGAIEFLDSTLDRTIRRWILPVIDSVSRAEKLWKAQSIFPVKRTNRKEAVIELVNDADEWLAACAVYWIYVYRDSELYEHLVSSAQRAEPLVRETAKTLMHRLNLALN